MMNDRSVRNKRVLEFICESYGVREDLLEILLYQYRYLIDEKYLETETRAKDRVTRFAVKKQRSKWQQQKLICRAYRYSPIAWVWPTQAALDEFGYPYLERKPAVSMLDHYHHQNLLRMHIEYKNRVDQTPVIWKSERQIRKEQPKDTHAADGEAQRPGTPVVAFEIELNQKKESDIDNILEQLAYRYEYIVYYSHPRVYRYVNSRLKRLNPFDKAKFTNVPLGQIPYAELSV